MGQVEEERPVLVPLDEPYRLVVQHVGQVALESRDLLVAIDGGVRDVDHVADRVLAANLLREKEPRVGRVREGVGALVQVEMTPLQVAVEVVEAAPGGEVLRLVAQVPFSQDAGGIALAAEQVGEGLFADVQAVGGLSRTPIGRDDPLQAVTLVVTSRQQRRACRGANGTGSNRHW